MLQLCISKSSKQSLADTKFCDLARCCKIRFDSKSATQCWRVCNTSPPWKNMVLCSKCGVNFPKLSVLEPVPPVLSPPLCKKCMKLLNATSEAEHKAAEVSSMDIVYKYSLTSRLTGWTTVCRLWMCIPISEESLLWWVRSKRQGIQCQM